MENMTNSEVIKAKLYDFFCKEAGVVIYKSDRDDEYSRELNDLLKIGRVVRRDRRRPFFSGFSVQFG